MPPKEKKRFLDRYRQFYEALPLYENLDNGKLIIAHAGIREKMIGEPFSKKVQSFVLYGDTTGETLPDGRPVRRDWAKKYIGDAWIVYGHTPVTEARFVNQTVNIDTGCVFGGKLTAVRYPEMEIVSVPSLQPHTRKIHSFRLIRTGNYLFHIRRQFACESHRFIRQRMAEPDSGTMQCLTADQSAVPPYKSSPASGWPSHFIWTRI